MPKSRPRKFRTFEKLLLCEQGLSEGQFFTRYFNSDPGSFSGNTTSTAPKSLVPGEVPAGDNGANDYLAMTNKRPMGQFGQDATFTPLLLMSNILNVCYTLFVNNDLCNVFLIMYNL